MSSLKPSKYIDLQPFQAWVQQSLPAVYDDSLSYTDLLAKMLAYLNNLVENNNTLSTDVTNAIDYINNYFDNLDVQDEINKKLDKMAEDGTLSRLIQPLFDEYKTEINAIIAEQNNKINKLSVYVTPEMFGAKGDGITDDTNAIQNALNYLKTLVSYTGTTEIPQNMEITGATTQSVSLVFSDKKYKFTTVYADCYGLILTGSGVLDGSIVIGDKGTIKWVDIKIEKLKFIHSNRKNSLVLKNVRRGQISNCTFIGSDSAIYVERTNVEYSQQVNQWIISNNSFIDCNYAFNTATSTGYLIGDCIISSNEISVNNIGVCVHGCDGITISSNKFFCLNANKGIMLDVEVNFVEIVGNSIFECKYNAIDISSYQNVNIANNNIPYAGEEDISSAIYLHGTDTSGTQYYNCSTIMGNNILQPSSSGIEISSGYVNIIGNNVIACGKNNRYRGTTPQNPDMLKAINSTRDTRTNLIMCNNTGENNFTSNTFGAYTNLGQLGFSLDSTTLNASDVINNTLHIEDGIGHYEIASPTSIVVINKITGGLCGQTIMIFSYNDNTSIQCNNSDIYGTSKQIPNNGYVLLTKITNDKWVLLN